MNKIIAIGWKKEKDLRGKLLEEVVNVSHGGEADVCSENLLQFLKVTLCQVLRHF